jgi:hypothetical protein
MSKPKFLKSYAHGTPITAVPGIFPTIYNDVEASLAWARKIIPQIFLFFVSYPLKNK